MAEHPMQPVIRAADGVIRFQPNPIVRHLLDWAKSRGMGLNELMIRGQTYGEFSDEDFEQFAQLIGYSVSGFGDLSYARPEAVQKADELAAAIREGEEAK